jgi:predicted acetyltransferase
MNSMSESKPVPERHPTLTLATESELPVVARLLQLYLHDFSELAGPDSPHGAVGDDGLFRYDSKFFDIHALHPDRPIWLARVDKTLAGFVFVHGWSASGEPVDRSIAEFFVMRKYRRGGIGRHLAEMTFRRHPGVWEVPVAIYNKPAQAFWRRVMAGLGVPTEERPGDGKRWIGPIHRFRIREATGWDMNRPY